MEKLEAVLEDGKGGLEELEAEAIGAWRHELLCEAVEFILSSVTNCKEISMLHCINLIQI